MRGSSIVVILLGTLVLAPAALAACSPTGCVSGLVRGASEASAALQSGSFEAAAEAQGAVSIARDEGVGVVACATTANPSWTATCGQAAAFVAGYSALDAGLVGGTALLLATLDAGYALSGASIAILP